MPTTLPRLPLGMQTFSEISKTKSLYVDKTTYLPQLRPRAKVIFIARPRLFGKSLTVSTLDSFFSGEKDLFQGLAAYEYMNSPDFIPRPVIRLDMNRIVTTEGLNEMRNTLSICLEDNAERHDVVLRKASPAAAFLRLIKEVRKKKAEKVVLLIDSCDTPVTDLLQVNEAYWDRVLIEKTSNIMSEFYAMIKSADEDLHFVFLTGITKFPNPGVGSSLNSSTDISLIPQFGAFMGITQDELEKYFAPFFGQTAATLKMTENDLLEKIKNYYCGFSFDGETRLYNPYSTLNFFRAPSVL